jgi:hypothetical protein
MEDKDIFSVRKIFILLQQNCYFCQRQTDVEIEIILNAFVGTLYRMPARKLRKWPHLLNFVCKRKE